MIRKLPFSLILILLSIHLQAQGIEFFTGTWKDALAKAKAEDKILFVDAYAKWCGPCKAMAKNVFPQAKVGEFYNNNFINLQLDMEETDGVTFGHLHPVTAYPTLMYLDGDGKVIKTVKGAQQADGLIALGADAIKKLDKSGRFEAKYLAGDRSYELMYQYVKALNNADKPSLKISNDYLSSNPEISENQRWSFLLEAATDADSKLFDEVIEHKFKIIALEGKAKYEDKCHVACLSSIDRAIEYEMESIMAETIKKAGKTFPDKASEFAATSQMKYYKAFKNEAKYKEAYKTLAKMAGEDGSKLHFIINDIVSTFKSNPSMVADAAEYAEKLYNTKEDMETLQMYCSLMILNKDVDKAIKTVNKAREKSEKEGGDLNVYDGLLNYLNSKKS
ncbi:MAG: thioredoxin family protein [Saprospiraceae bacterium]